MLFIQLDDRQTLLTSALRSVLRRQVPPATLDIYTSRGSTTSFEWRFQLDSIQHVESPVLYYLLDDGSDAMRLAQLCTFVQRWSSELIILGEAKVSRWYPQIVRQAEDLGSYYLVGGISFSTDLVSAMQAIVSISRSGWYGNYQWLGHKLEAQGRSRYVPATVDRSA